MEDLKAFLAREFLGNSYADYAWTIGSILVGIVAVRYLSRFLSKLLYKALNKWSAGSNPDELFKLIHKPIEWLLMLIILYACTSHIEFPEHWDMAPKSEFGLLLILNRVYSLFLIGVITWAVMRLVDFFKIILLYQASLTESKSDDQIIPFGAEIVKISIAVFAVFFALGAVFKVDIGALIAGLGIGGLALALAAKESLENLLASFVIFWDKPFVIGDLVQVGDVIGTVEQFGFRSTRIRTLEKSYLTLPNRLMIDDKLDNLSLRTFRRVKFNVGLLYQTSEAQLKNIVADIQSFIDAHPNTNQDGEVRFLEFNSSSLDIMVLYFIDTMDWSVFLRIKEEINYEIMRIVKKHGADFAYPTQTLFINKE